MASHGEEPLLTARGLTKFYGDAAVLQDLSFEIRSGEILGLLGPNGAGKTTTLHILLGLLKPTSGEVSFLGLSPLRDRVKIAEKLNFSSAYGSMPANLTVGENLDIMARLYRVSDAPARIRSVLELFEMEPLRHRLAGALSAGEKTKLNLAKSLLNDPLLLILDEPTASLDPDMADKVRQLLVRVQREKKIGIIYTSHNMHEVETLCSRVIFIHRGRRIAEGTPAEVLTQCSARTLEQAFIKMVRSGDLVAREEGS